MRRARNSTARLLLPLCLVGCGPLIGADDYASAEPQLPLNGFLDRLGGVACRECILGACQNVFDQCQASAECAEYLDCLTTNPGMSFACRPPVDFDLLALAAQLSGCWSGCKQPCNVGRVWSCNRAFDANEPLPGVTSSTCFVTYGDSITGKPLSGIDVRACRRDDPACVAPVSSKAPPTDAEGHTTVGVTWPPVSPISPKPGFDGYLELTSKVIDPPWWPMLRFVSNRVVGDWGDSAVMFNANDPSVKALLELGGGIDLDTSLAGLAVEIHDCLGEPAPGIRFEVSQEPGPNPVPLVYLDDQGNLDPKLSATTKSSLAFGANLVGTSGKVVARFADSGEVIREVKFRLRAGAAHVIDIRPGPRNP